MAALRRERIVGNLRGSQDVLSQWLGAKTKAQQGSVQIDNLDTRSGPGLMTFIPNMLRFISKTRLILSASYASMSMGYIIII